MAPIRRKKSLRRRWRRAFVWALLVLVALGGALYALRVRLAGAVVRARLEAALSDLVGGRVAVDEIEELDFGHVRARGIRLVDGADSTGVFDALAVATLDVDFSTWALVQGKKRAIHKVKIRDAQLELVFPAKGTRSTGSATSTADETPLDLAEVFEILPEIDLSGAQIGWRAGRAARGEAHAVSARLEKASARSLELTVESAALDFQATGVARSIRRASIVASADPGSFRVREVAWDGERLANPVAGDLREVASGRAAFSIDYANAGERLRGTLETVWKGEGRMRGRFDDVSIEVSSARLEPFASSPVAFALGLEGRIDVSVSSLDSPDELSAEGDLDLRISGSVANRRLETGRVVLARRDGQTVVEACRLQGEGVSLEGSGALAESGELAVDLRLDVELDQTELPEASGAGLGGAVAASGRIGGILSRPRFSGKVAWRRPRLFGGAFDRLTLDFSTDGERVDVRDALFEKGGKNRVALSGNFAIREPRQGNFSGRAELGDPVALAREFAVDLGPTDHVVTVDFDLGGTASEPEGRARLASRGSAFGGRSVSSLDAEISFRHQTFEASELVLVTEDLVVEGSLDQGTVADNQVTVRRIRLSGRVPEDPSWRIDLGGTLAVDLAARTMVLGLEARGIEPAPLARRFVDGRISRELDELAGSFDLDIGVRGLLERPDVELRMISRALAWRNIEGTFDAEASLAPGGDLEIRKIDLGVEGGRIGTTGRILSSDPPSFDLVVDVENVRIDDRFLPRGISNSLELEVRVDARALAIRGPAGDLSIEGRARISEGRVDSPAGVFGEIATDLYFEGTRVRLQEGRLVWNRQGVPEMDVQVDLAYETGRVAGSALAGGAWGKARVTGTVLVAGDGPIAAQTTVLDLEAGLVLDLSVYPGELEGRGGVRGRLVAEGVRVTGNASRPQYEGTILIVDAGFQPASNVPGVSDLSGRIVLAGRRLLLQGFEGQWLDRPLTLGPGSIDFEKGTTPAVRTSFALSPVPIARLLETFAGARSNPQGLPAGDVSFVLEVGGDFDSPRIGLLVRSEEVTLDRFRFEDVLIVATYEESRLSVPRFDLVSDLVAVRGTSGSIPISPAGSPADEVGETNRLEVTLDVAPLERVRPPLVPDLEGAGTITLAILGSLDRPRFEALLAFEGVRYAPGGSEIRLTEGTGLVRATVDPDRRIVIALERSMATISGGSLEASGTAEVVDGEVANVGFRVKGSNVLVLRYDDLIVRVSPRLEIEGPYDSPLVRGEVEIDRAVYLRDFEIIHPDVTIRRQKGASASAGNESGAAQDAKDAASDASPAFSLPPELRLDIRILSDEGVSIKNKVCEGYADADLHLTGSTKAPVLTGAIEIRRGKITFQGNTIDVTLGEFRFTEEELLIPRIRLLGTTTVDRYDVTIEVRGDRHGLRILPQSAPTLSEDQILGLLITGRLPQAEPAGGRGAEAADALSKALEDRGFKWESYFLGRQIRMTVNRIEYDLGEGFAASASADPVQGLTLGVSWRIEFE